MTSTDQNSWQNQFGVAESKPPRFFTGTGDLDSLTPQGHLIRRAFDALDLDGVLCADHSPLVYFKQVAAITAEEVFRLHKLFWNHGGAPVLVLITDAKVHVYSGMSRPVAGTESFEEMPSLVSTLDRVATGLREFLTSVESGEFFRQHPKSFNPDHRVDRALLENLTDTREALVSATRRKIPTDVLDALLCRLVFTCYLFDRGVIGQTYLSKLSAKGASHLREVLAIQPATSAKSALYSLFKKLGKDFNGDLFSDDLDAEAEYVHEQHIKTLKDFFHGTSVRSGQRAFWPYDFSIIPIETISAIYEQFLKEVDEKSGAFYTPRFLAEVVLDTALDGFGPTIGKKYLDPACGSGIFLVGLFNRMAEEWKLKNPTARNPRRARELMAFLQEGLFGVDINPTACRITAFSLYLAYLDQLTPRDIQEHQEQGRFLPHLIATNKTPGNIRRADFFDATVTFPADVDLVIGNPPWGSTATGTTPAGQWCVSHQKPVPDKQIAAAFIWKATQHVAEGGRICFVLPHGVLFNHSATAISFQKTWVQSHAIDRVLNLADFQRFLFEKAGHPALVVSYGKLPPETADHRIEYWSPKADWTVTKAEVITISPQDRTVLTVGQVLRDLEGADAPQIWKQRYWATPRDWRLLDRLSLYPRLRDMVRQSRERETSKRWLLAEGFQPVGENDDTNKVRSITLPSKLFIKASSKDLDLFLLTRDCEKLSSNQKSVRNKSNKNTQVFRGPHILVTKGYSSVAFADFDVSFQHALRGITGPAADRELLLFLAAYLRTNLARYFLFHTSSNWGISRQEVHVEEILRLPFVLPENQPDVKRSRQIINDVARIVDEAAGRADKDMVDRAGIVRSATSKIEPLVEEYFDILPAEKALIEDTIRVTIDSTRPTRARPLVPTLISATRTQQEAYRDTVCEMLNGWAKGGQYAVRGEVAGSQSLGVGIAILEKVERNRAKEPMTRPTNDLVRLLDTVRKAIPQKQATLDIVRGVMVFHGKFLYVIRPIGQRHWTQTTAMNDADEIAGTILMRSSKEDA